MTCFRFVAPALLIVMATGCSESPGNTGGQDGGGRDGSAAGPVSIVVSPPDVDLLTDGITPATQTFVARGIYADGSDKDLSAVAEWSLSDPVLGSVSGGEFSSGLAGGQAEVRAEFEGVSGSAQLKLRVEREVVGPGLPADPGILIANAPEDLNRIPALVYPNADVLLPTNLGSLEIHFRPGANNTVFALNFRSPQAELTIYTRCQDLNGGCLYTLEGELWDSMAETNAGLAAIELTLTGTDDQGTARASAPALSFSFSAKKVEGGIYYWTTDRGRIVRVDFGAGGQPENYYPRDGDTNCYGCHAVSPDGRKMSLSRSGQRDGRLTLIDVANDTVTLQNEDGKREQFQTWDPTSSKIAGIWSDGPQPDTDIRIRDGVNGDVLETINLGVEPSHPDWSPRGDRIVFTRVTEHNTSQRPGRGGLSYVQNDGSDWSAPVELIAPEDEHNRYYPAYAPDASFLVYCESTCPPGSNYEASCDGDADPSAKMFAMTSNGGPSIALAAANAPGAEDSGNDLANTFPKWAPFVDARSRDGSGRVMWFTFSSRRAYGLRLPNRQDQWLWMAAVDPDAIARGEDGSLAAFALPFQDLATSNHIAQWTSAIVGTPEPDPGGPDDCTAFGSPCDPNGKPCCTGACLSNGPDIYICRPDI